MDLIAGIGSAAALFAMVKTAEVCSTMLDKNITGDQRTAYVHTLMSFQPWLQVDALGELGAAEALQGGSMCHFVLEATIRTLRHRPPLFGYILELSICGNWVRPPRMEQG